MPVADPVPEGPAALCGISAASTVKAGAGRVVLARHKPDRTDQDLDLLAARFAVDPHVIVAAEGTVIDL
jgi:hypothetical protein